MMLVIKSYIMIIISVLFFYTYCILKNKNNSFYDEFNFVNRMDKNIFISISIYDINFKNN